MFDIHQDVFDRDGERDESRCREYMDGLMDEFAEAPEAQPVKEANGSIHWAAVMMEYAINHVGCTPGNMTVGDFDEVVFELFPRKVSVEAEQAGEIIVELRAFWSFVDRQYGLPNAREILATLDDGATRRLENELANPANYGMAKSFFMKGKQAGFDMTTPEGLAAFQAAYNASLPSNRPGLLPPDPYPGLDLTPVFPIGAPIEKVFGSALKQKRKEKKKQREAKKRNRSR